MHGSKLCLGLVCLFAVLLTGCYESSSDLIEERAVEIKRFDSVLVINRNVYYLIPQGKHAVACLLQTKQDVQKPCKGGRQVKFERTFFGNYIVQYSEGREFKYGLWLRSEKDSIGKTLACVYWLGDGIVNVGDISPSALKATYGDTPLFRRLTQDVKGVSTERLIDRKQLLEIVSIYERTLLTPSGQDSFCLERRVPYWNEHVVLDKDNRHIPDLE